ncbi:MAG: four helix bundle protein [Desulfobacterales bacterium]|uniref:Four helix bundle protein n=1 Tax=Candidatus Desulfatibia profunda TaxID=2841695 RepID=A0A8J6NKT4_9BACT|nr:four helix bundle protein [Candidatus Desulfatibia profunda]MBL7179077.1 four helix bundle protein [Desulfobacterales bacterium]
MGKKVQYHWELEVYQMSVEAAMQIFEISKGFPKEEVYSLTDQIRRSSRSVSSAIAESWRRRKYEKAFVNKLNESESEAAETQVWLEYAVKCEYISRDVGKDLHKAYDNIIGKLVTMGNNPEPWLLKPKLMTEQVHG